MGFMAGFGPAFNASATEAADLEHRAKIARQQALVASNLELAKVLLKSPNHEHRAQGMAIFADPSKPFKAGEDHPETEKVKRVIQALGSGAVGQEAVTSGMPGMAGMTSPENSPLVQAGIVGDQGMPPQGAPQQAPPPGPPSPPIPPPGPQPAAMTTNPPPMQGGVISPQAAAPASPPQGATPQPPPPPPPDAVMAAMQASQQGATPPQFSPFDPEQVKLMLIQKLQQETEMRHARALQAGGAAPEATLATLGGKEGTTILKQGMQAKATSTENDKKIGANQTLAEFRAQAASSRALATDQRKFAQQALMEDVKFSHAKHLKSLGVNSSDAKVTWQEVPDPTDPDGLRTVKMPVTNATAKAMASKGETLQGKVPGLILNRIVSAGAADHRLAAIEKDLPELAEHLGPYAGRIANWEQLAGVQDPVIQRFLTNRSQVAAYMTSMHGARGATLMKQFESAAGELKDNPEAVKTALQELREGTNEFINLTKPPRTGSAVNSGASAGSTGGPPKPPAGTPKKIGRFLVQEN